MIKLTTSWTALQNGFKPVITALLLLICIGRSAISIAAIGAYDFESDDQRLRYQFLVHELRCPKCQNQNLSDSNSQIAIDLRDEVARMVLEGRPDDEIKNYMVSRYGDFVLYRPPVQSNTLVLWWAPVLMMGLGALIFFVIVLRRRAGIENSDNLPEENEGTDSAKDNNEKA